MILENSHSVAFKYFTFFPVDSEQQIQTFSMVFVAPQPWQTAKSVDHGDKKAAMQLYGTSHLLHASGRETIQFSQFEILSGFTSYKNSYS